jgi:hypothetical protein
MKLDKDVLQIIGLLVLISCIVIACALVLLFYTDIRFATNPALKAICFVTIDRTDNQTVTERQGTAFIEVKRYHEYELCLDRNRTTLSNTSMGYRTFEEWMYVDSMRYSLMRW